MIRKSYQHFNFNLVKLLLIGCGLAVSLSLQAQTPNAKSKDYLDAAHDDNDSTDAVAPTKPSKWVAWVYGDFGGSTLKGTSGGTSQTAKGLTWALCGQVGYKLKSKHSYDHLILSAGLEVRNLNGTQSSNDGNGGTEYDNEHLYFVGVPIVFQYVNTKHRPNKKHDVNFYGQAGISIDFKVSANDVNSDQGTTTRENDDSLYKTIIIQPYLSAGVSFTTKKNIFLLGPFIATTINNFSKESGLTVNATSYGIRLSTTLFR